MMAVNTKLTGSIRSTLKIFSTIVISTVISKVATKLATTNGS